MRRNRPRYRPSDLTDVQKIAITSVIDTGGLNDVISARYSLRTVRALRASTLSGGSCCGSRKATGPGGRSLPPVARCVTT